MFDCTLWNSMNKILNCFKRNCQAATKWGVIAKNWSLLALNSRSCLSWARVGCPTNSTSSTFNSNLVPQASDLGDNMLASVLSEKLGKKSIRHRFDFFELTKWTCAYLIIYITLLIRKFLFITVLQKKQLLKYDWNF